MPVEAEAGFHACTSTNNPWGSTAPDDDGGADLCYHNSTTKTLVCKLENVCKSTDSQNQAEFIGSSSDNAWKIRVRCYDGSTYDDFCSVFEDSSNDTTQVHLYGTANDDYLAFQMPSWQMRKLTQTLEAKVWAGDGHDIVLGSNWTTGFREYLYGEDGPDHLFGEGDSDFLDGGPGNDYCDGGSGHDDLYGDADEDLLVGDDGEDTEFGGPGNDHLCGHAVSGVPANLKSKFSASYGTGQTMNWRTWGTLTCNTTSTDGVSTMDTGSGNDVAHTGKITSGTNKVEGGTGQDLLYGYGSSTGANWFCDPGQEGDVLDISASTGGTPVSGTAARPNKLRITEPTTNVLSYLTGNGSDKTDCTDDPNIVLTDCYPIGSFSCPF